MPDPLKQYHPITNEFREQGWPTVMFTEDCDGDPETKAVDGGTISEFEEWEIREQASEHRNAPEEPETKDDHGPDAACYCVQSYFGDKAPENQETVMTRIDTEQEKLRKIIVEDLKKSLGKNKKSGFPKGSTLQGSVY